jgi:replicative DNA helicase
VTTTTYAEAVPIYRAQSWPSFLPLPRRAKVPPPSGFTGWDGAWPSGADYQEWIDSLPTEANGALRLPGIVAGLDVDAYDGRTGALTMAEAQRRWGPLPAAPMSTSRAEGSGIGLYRIPEGAILRTNLGFSELGIGNVEIVQRHHRYAMAWPSIHPEGRLYRWYDATGAVMDLLPAVDELPELPPAWCEALAGTGEDVKRARPEQVAAFLDALPAGMPCELVKHRFDAATAALRARVDSRHDDTCGHVLALLRLGEEGHPGVPAALGELRAEFVDAVTADRTRTTAEAVAEFDRMAQGERGIGLILAEPTDPAGRGCKCGIPPNHGQNRQNPPQAGPASGSVDSVPAFGDPWNGEPVDLGRAPAALPVDALGDTMGPMVAAVAEGYQIPTDLAVNLALPLVTTAAAGHWTARVTTDWSEPASIATVSALNSGERKSPTARALAAPLVDYERDLQDAQRPEIARKEAELKLKIDRAERLRKEALKGAIPGGLKEMEYIDAEEEVSGFQVPALPRLLADDVTPERLAGLLAEQRGALGLISTEPGLFAILGGRYSNGAANVENVLKATSGDPIRVDRQGRDPVTITDTALSIGVCIQPGLLAELGRGTFRRSGLLARFAYVLPAPLVGTRTISPNPVPEPIAARWRDHLRALAEHAHTHRETRAELTLTPDAAARLDTFRSALEPHLHPHHGRLAELADWGSKLPGLVVRIAAALTVLADPTATDISGAVLGDAIRLGRGYIDHARAAFGMIHGRDDALHRAREVLGWLTHNGEPVVTLRDIHRALRGRAWVTSAVDVRAALDTLAEYGHVRRVREDRPPGQPGRPSEQYQLHPNHLPTLPQPRRALELVPC